MGPSKNLTLHSGVTTPTTVCEEGISRGWLTTYPDGRPHPQRDPIFRATTTTTTEVVETKVMTGPATTRTPRTRVATPVYGEVTRDGTLDSWAVMLSVRTFFRPLLFSSTTNLTGVSLLHLNVTVSECDCDLRRSGERQNIMT